MISYLIVVEVWATDKDPHNALYQLVLVRQSHFLQHSFIQNKTEEFSR